jgi:hypothetical protein
MRQFDLEIDPPIPRRGVRQMGSQFRMRDSDDPLGMSVRARFFGQEPTALEVNLQAQATLISHEERLSPLLKQIIRLGFRLVLQVTAKESECRALNAIATLRLEDPAMNWQGPSHAIGFQMPARSKHHHDLIRGIARRGKFGGRYHGQLFDEVFV